MASHYRQTIRSYGFRITTLSLLIGFVWTFALAQTSSFINVPGTTWASRFDGIAHDNERYPVMTLDGHNNVYVAAESRSLNDNPAFASTPDMDIVTIKFDSAGHQQWADTVGAITLDGICWGCPLLTVPHEPSSPAAGGIFRGCWRSRRFLGLRKLSTTYQ